MRFIDPRLSHHIQLITDIVIASDSRKYILLGPQSGHQHLTQVLRGYGINGPVALVTAGWEQAEADDDELRTLLNRPVSNLRLHDRAERLFSQDAELFELLRKRQDRLRELRDIYRMRLSSNLDCARRVMGQAIDHPRLKPECDSAIHAIKLLDREYTARTSAVCKEFEKRMNTAKRPMVVKHRAEISEMLQNVEALLIAGGHVAVLLNRLKIFGLLELKPQRPIVAWSGAVMALSNRIVLFHDSPPQGPGNPEVLRAGLRCLSNIIPLPHARKRLQLDDRVRVALFARRFEPEICLVMDPETHLSLHKGQWQPHSVAKQLGADGQLTEFSP